MTKRLMVIDDERAIGDIVAEVARDFGFEPTALQDATGLDAAALEQVDVLVLDLLMPGIDGIEVIRRVAMTAHRPQLLLMSGLERRTLDAARAVAAAKGIHVCDVIRKPFRPAELRQLFEKHCGKVAGADERGAAACQP